MELISIKLSICRAWCVTFSCSSFCSVPYNSVMWVLFLLLYGERPQDLWSSPEMTLPYRACQSHPQFCSWYVAGLEVESRTLLSLPAPMRMVRMGQADLRRLLHLGQVWEPQPAGPSAPKSRCGGLVYFCPLWSLACPLTSDPELFVPIISQCDILAKNKVKTCSLLQSCCHMRGQRSEWCGHLVICQFGPETNSKVYCSLGYGRHRRLGSSTTNIS